MWVVANVNPKVIGGGGKKRKTRKTKRNYKKGGYKYNHKKLKSMKLSRSKSKSRSKSRGGMSLSHYYPLNKDPTSIGRPVPGKSQRWCNIDGIVSLFQEGGSTGASGISNLTFSRK